MSFSAPVACLWAERMSQIMLQVTAYRITPIVSATRWREVGIVSTQIPVWFDPGKRPFELAEVGWKPFVCNSLPGQAEDPLFADSRPNSRVERGGRAVPASPYVYEAGR